VIRAEAKGKTLHFDYDSMVGSNEVFKDRETGSKWQQTLSTATSGPLKGTHLEIYPFLLTRWGEWRKQHPDTLVLKPMPGYDERMAGMNRFIDQGWQLAVSNKPAPPGAFGHDNRLPPREIILGLEIGDVAKAYPLSVLHAARVINDRVGKVAVVVVHQPGTQISTCGGRSGSTRRPGNALDMECVRSLPFGKAQRIAAESRDSRAGILVCVVGISSQDRSVRCSELTFRANFSRC
jgi:Protein of unknown function (DUF3179)